VPLLFLDFKKPISSSPNSDPGTAGKESWARRRIQVHIALITTVEEVVSEAMRWSSRSSRWILYSGLFEEGKKKKRKPFSLSRFIINLQ
jgi:hypothetical protein